MSSSDFWYGVGDLFTESFAILRAGGNAVNWVFIVAIAIALITWLGIQTKYNATEMKEDGKLK